MEEKGGADPPPALLALIKENPSVISPPSRRSKPHGRAIMFKCETITTGRQRSATGTAAVFVNSSNFAFEVGITSKLGTLTDGSA